MKLKSTKRASKAIERWHAKALLVDLDRTKIVILSSPKRKRKHVPPWLHKKSLE